MAGRPKRRAMIAELERQTRLIFEDDRNATHLDFACLWIEGGGTLKELAEKLMPSEDSRTAAALVSKYLRGAFDEGERRIEESRRVGADAQVDISIAISEEDVGKDGAARQRNRISARQWIAERANRQKYGQQVKIEQTQSITVLHLNALRARTIDAPALPKVAEDAEILAIEAPDHDERE